MLSHGGRLELKAHHMENGTQDQRGKATKSKATQPLTWGRVEAGGQAGNPSHRGAPARGRENSVLQPCNPLVPPGSPLAPLASEGLGGRADKFLGRGIPQPGPWRSRDTRTRPPPHWSHGPQTGSRALTIVLPAVLFHVNLQLPFGGLAVGITVCRGGEHRQKT